MPSALYELGQYEMHRFDPQTDDPGDLPEGTGIYAICARDVHSLRPLSISAVFPLIGGDYVVYIGISETQGLRKRDYKNHFNGTARNSTLRKSLGSLFRWQADRVALDNGKYRFTPERERELSDWMRNHLVMLYWQGFPQGIPGLETKLINELSPPLNIRKNKSPVNQEFRKELKRLRKK
jgi:hypothetical protein